jgi:hypothetical protein
VAGLSPARIAHASAPGRAATILDAQITHQEAIVLASQRSWMGAIGAALVLLTLTGFAGEGRAERFLGSAWLCVSPDAHQQAEALGAGQEGEAWEAVRKRLLDERQCTWLAERDLIKVVTGVRIHEIRGGLARVSFGFQAGDQMPGKERTETFYRMIVWTARANLSAEDE